MRHFPSAAESVAQLNAPAAQDHNLNALHSSRDGAQAALGMAHGVLPEVSVHYSHQIFRPALKPDSASVDEVVSFPKIAGQQGAASAGSSVPPKREKNPQERQDSLFCPIKNPTSQGVKLRRSHATPSEILRVAKAAANATTTTSMSTGVVVMDAAKARVYRRSDPLAPVSVSPSAAANAAASGVVVGAVKASAYRQPDPFASVSASPSATANAAASGVMVGAVKAPAYRRPDPFASVSVSPSAAANAAASDVAVGAAKAPAYRRLNSHAPVSISPSAAANAVASAVVVDASKTLGYKQPNPLGLAGGAASADNNAKPLNAHHGSKNPSSLSPSAAGLLVQRAPSPQPLNPAAGLAPQRMLHNSSSHSKLFTTSSLSSGAGRPPVDTPSVNQDKLKKLLGDVGAVAATKTPRSQRLAAILAVRYDDDARTAAEVRAKGHNVSANGCARFS